MSSKLVVNIKSGQDYDVYIGRPNESGLMHWGNPFTHKEGTKASVKVATRDMAVKAFRDWLAGSAYQDIEPKRRQWILDNISMLKGKVLACWCAPQACHGDVLAELANANEEAVTEPKVIDSFDGQYRFLSNFYPVTVHLNGIDYPSVENAYQAAKLVSDPARIAFKNMTPGQAKRAGAKVQLREDWPTAKIEVMLYLLKQKFQDPELKALLDKTGDAQLIEGNTWGDTFWGVCNGEGHNILGRMLMKVRKENRMKKKFIMGTDGSAHLPSVDENCPGGWAAVILGDGVIAHAGGARTGQTSQTMELAGFGYGLRAFMRLIEDLGLEGSDVELKVVLDSKYAYNGYFGECWVEQWEVNDWKNSANKPVANKALWVHLGEVLGQVKSKGITLEVVRETHKGGKTGSDEETLNKMADKQAAAQREMLKMRGYKHEPFTYIYQGITKPIVDRSVSGYESKKGNILDTKAQAVVITVNCQGIMGRGLALDFKERYPLLFSEYFQQCKDGRIAPGKVGFYDLSKDQCVFWFPTKVHWRNDSTLELIDTGLADLVQKCKNLKIESIAIPPLGCGLGKLDWAEVKPRILKAFAGTGIAVELWE